MNVIDLLTSSPLPATVSTVIAIAAAAGYYFFVIPMIAELAETKKENAKLRKDLSETRSSKKRENDIAIDNILKSQLEINQALSGLAVDMNKEKGFSEILKVLEDMEDNLKRQDPNQLTTFVEVKAMLQNLIEHSTHARTSDANVQNLLNEVVRFLHTINDKQSQIIGALLGMTRIQDRNRSL